MGFWDGPAGDLLAREWQEVKRVPLTLVVVLILGLIAGYWFKSELANSKIAGLEQLVSNLQLGVRPTAPEPSVTLFPNVPGRVAVAVALGFIVTALLAWRNARKIGTLRSEIVVKDVAFSSAQQRDVVSARRESELLDELQTIRTEFAREITVFLHDAGDSEFATTVREFFASSGWRVVPAATNLPQHASGVRLIGGSQSDRLMASWALTILGVVPVMDEKSGAPTLQAIIGAARRFTTQDASLEIKRLTGERDSAMVALKDRKSQYAMETLDRVSMLQFRDGSRPRVTIRYGHYGSDYELAQRIHGLFTQYAKWTVTLDGSNNPALQRAGECPARC